jgi:glycosyltransferase involved in cell wall biosynthesis
VKSLTNAALNMPDGMIPRGDAEGEVRPLRVLQIGMEWFTPTSAGGLARVYADLFKSLPQVGIEPVGLVSGPDGVAEMTGGHVRSFTHDGASFAGRLLGARQGVNHVLRTERVDVVAGHFALYAFPALDALKRQPLVFHFHGPWAAEARREGHSRAVVAIKQVLETLVYRRAQRVIVLSHAFGELAARSYGIPEDRLRQVTGSVDIARFAVPQTREVAREILGWPNDRPILLTVRRLASRMGLDHLLTAMVMIVKAVPEVLLHIAGKGPLGEALRQQATSLGLDKNVRFLGFIPDHDLPFAYCAADINLLPTDMLEGFGLSAAEALAAGTPSMVTPVGGLPDVVSDLSSNLIFRSGSSEDLAVGLTDALLGRIQLPDSKTCRRYAASRFDPLLFARRVADVYREVG